MAGGLIALLDDVAAIAKLAAASLDDIGATAGRASSKAVGVVIDDTAVTPRYVVGLSPQRELPIIGRIALGSLRNKLLILLPAALLLSALAPWALTPLLMLGGAYLCFEGAEKVIEAVTGHHAEDATEDASSPKALEDAKVAGAIRTDFILSAEIMALALAEVTTSPIVSRAIILAIVAIAITAGVYGVVAIIVKVDDIGLHLAKSGQAAVRAIGRGLVSGMPAVLRVLTIVGIAAMIWVGGGILIHGLEVLGLPWIAHVVHDVAHRAEVAAPAIGGTVGWLVGAALSGVFGLIIGGLIAGLLYLLPKAGGSHGGGNTAPS